MPTQNSLPGINPDDPLRPSDIRRIVAEKLVGLRDRQRVREAIRKRKRKKRNRDAQAMQAHLGEDYFMKSPVVFRAIFKGPIGALNPAGFQFAGEVEVEIYHAKTGPPAEWRVRRPGTRLQFPIAAQSRPDTVKSQMLLYFSLQITSWTSWDTSISPSEMLQDDEWKIDNAGHVFLTEERRERQKANSVTKGTK